MGRFVPRKEREIELGEKAKRFTNVYVKNFNEDMTEDDLQKMFDKFGKITSLKVTNDINHSKMLIRSNVVYFIPRFRIMVTILLPKECPNS